MAVLWKQPSIPGAAEFAEWEGATFALVREMADGRWRAAVFPDGESHHAMNAFAGSERQAKAWIEKWAARNHHAIAPAKGRHIMPHEGQKPRKPKGADDRS